MTNDPVGTARSRTTQHPDDPDVIWEMKLPFDLPNLKSLTLCGTTSDNPIAPGGRDGNPVLPETPGGVAAPDPQNKGAVLQPTDFPVLYKQMTEKVGYCLKSIVSNYTILLSVFCAVCRRNKHWAEKGMPPRDYTYELFGKEEVDWPGDINKPTARAYVWRFLDKLQTFHALAAAGWDHPLDQFPGTWPPPLSEIAEDGMDVAVLKANPAYYAVVPGERRPATALLVEMTVKLLMDTQGYHLPRKFVVDVRVPNQSDPSGADDGLGEPYLSSSSSTYFASSSSSSSSTIPEEGL